MKIVYIFTVSLLSLPAFSQNRYKGELKFREKLEIIDKEVFKADIEADISDIRLPSQSMIVITPKIVSGNSPDSIVFSPVIITGRNKTKTLRRSYSLSGETPEILIIKRKNGKEQAVPLHFSTPFRPWMKDSRVVLDEKVYGCVNCGISASEYEFGMPYVEPYVPRYVMSYIVPEVEPVKERSRSHSAKFNYKVARYELLRDFGNNAAEFSEIKRIMDELHNDRNLTVNTLSIRGYASPEGSVQSNLALSKNRAYSFAKYMEVQYGFNEPRIDIKWYGEDWEGLRKAVEASSIADRDQVLHIIDTETDIPTRESKIMQLSGGRTYQVLLKDFYPPLRRNDLTANFVVKSFDLEEARQIIRTQPQYLSLNEMYLVANSYPKGSAEFREVFDIAVRLYPNDPVTIQNAAAAELEAGLNDRAIQRLLKLDLPEAWNNLGIAYAKTGDVEKAKFYFDKAAEAGVESAGVNAAELSRSQE